MYLKRTLLGGLVTLTLSTTAYGQETSDGTQVFEPAYFEQFVPRTAIDMVSRIPGFQIRSSGGRRGLGQGGANVLINGDRISGKTNAGDQLSRINAANVVRIEIVDGTSLDIPGLSGQVANVITKSTGVSGTWEWRPEWRNRLPANLYDLKATVSGESGDLAWSFTAQNNPFRNGNRGLETLTDANGVLFETRNEDAQFFRDNPGVAADLTWKPKQDHVGNLNLKYNQVNFNGREQSRSTAVTAAGTTGETLFSNAEDEWNASVDVDYEFPFL
ncbi:Plug domain-containing protein, partial [bacterium AH-315-J19]|nr:Plug domain-containing protein [bacterium AH-315-J19]